MSAPDFIDECRIFVRSGDGGRGCCSFRREKFVPRGGPDGGNGGRGGSVWLIADRQLATLLDTRHRKFYRAPRGAHGSGARKDGKWGEDVEVRLPLGTVVKDDATREVLVELIEDGQTWLAVEGGLGGRGNAMFATSTNQAPLTVEPGQEGEERWLRLELKVLADVGLIGFPNAGKSTLLRRISGARPRVAAYPFTTLVPSLGVGEVGERRFIVADIPGLIEGASEGAGLGDRFLRHVERTRVLVHLVDAGSLALGPRDLVADYEAIRRELEAYEPTLLARPEIVALTKIDLLADRSPLEPVAAELAARGREVVRVSAATGEGIEELLRAVANALEAALAAEHAA